MSSGAIGSERERLTYSAAPHVWSELHAIRTGARVLGGVVCDLRGFQAEVLTAAVGQASHIAGIRGLRGQKDRKKETETRCGYFELQKIWNV